MNILITGGYGFLGPHIADRFKKDGHRIVIIDNGTRNSTLRPAVEHKYYKIDTTSHDCSNIFGSFNFDIVIHLASGRSVSCPGDSSSAENDADLSGLANMLSLSEKNGVRKFVIISCSSIYGNPGNLRELPFRETDGLEPVNPAGMNNYIREYYTNTWSRLFSLETLCIRASNIYGPGQHRGEGVISSFMENTLSKKSLVINGYGTQTRDFIYIEDFVEALYWALHDGSGSGIVNISTNRSCSISDLAGLFSTLFGVKKIEYRNNHRLSINHSRLDNTRIKRTGWEPRYSLEEGLKKTFTWYREQHQADRKKTGPGKKIGRALKNFPRQPLAYIENIIAFLIVAFIQYNHLFLDLYTPELALDYSLIYIAIMGILWGQRQAYLAMILSSALFIGSALYSGTDIVSFIYTPGNLLRIAAYVLIGVITGYTIEKRNRDLEAKDYALNSLTKKYDLLNDVYNETRVVKEELQNQIIETEDSFGVIYGIVQEVDSLEIEKVFAASIDAIERIMKTDSVSIYTVKNSGHARFMRLKTRSNSLRDIIPNSIDLEKSPEFKEVITSRSLIVNRELKEGIPIIMAPVMDGANVIALVSLHRIPFESLTMHYENLFQTVISLISNALKRAYFFEASLRDKRYINNTRILNPHTFDKILDEVREKESELGMSYSLLKISSGQNDPLNILSDAIVNCIRDNDYIGLSRKNKMYILLSNTAHDHARIVVDRLKRHGISSNVIQKGQDDL